MRGKVRGEDIVGVSEVRGDMFYSGLDVEVKLLLNNVKICRTCVVGSWRTIDLHACELNLRAEEAGSV